MKKSTKGMNKRALKRKMGIDEQKLENMFQDIRQLVDSHVLQKGADKKETITIDQNKLMHALKDQMNMLEKEWKALKNDAPVPTPEPPSPKKGIKINISQKSANA